MQLASDWERAHSSEELAAEQDIPSKFLEAILSELKRIGLVSSSRGPGGGYRLRIPPSQIAVADVLSALTGAETAIRDECPEDLHYQGVAQPLQDVWVAVRAALRSVLETTTLADIVSGELPAEVAALAATPDAWVSHWYTPADGRRSGEPNHRST